MENNFDIITEQSYYLLSVDSLYYHYEALSSDEKLMKQLQGNFWIGEVDMIMIRNLWISFILDVMF